MLSRRVYFLHSIVYYRSYIDINNINILEGFGGWVGGGGGGGSAPFYVVKVFISFLPILFSRVQS